MQIAGQKTIPKAENKQTNATPEQQYSAVKTEQTLTKAEQGGALQPQWSSIKDCDEQEAAPQKKLKAEKMRQVQKKAGRLPMDLFESVSQWRWILHDRITVARAK